MTMTYNGWTNNETWNAQLFLNGDYCSDADAGRAIIEATIKAVKAPTVGQAADKLRDHCRELMQARADRALPVDHHGAPALDAWMRWAMMSYLDEIDWHQLAAWWRDPANVPQFAEATA